MTARHGHMYNAGVEDWRSILLAVAVYLVAVAVSRLAETVSLKE